MLDRSSVLGTYLGSHVSQGVYVGPQATTIGNLLYKVIADSSAVDLEALIVLRGRRAWTLYLDLTVLNHDGNLTDLSVFSAMAAFSAFRLPQTKVSNDGNVSIIPADEQEPLALTIQHVPFAVTFALIGSADDIAVDPSRIEAAAAAGTVTIICNEFEELCGLQKVDGIGMELEQLLRCVRLATSSAAEYGEALSSALERHRLTRVQHRVRRTAGDASAAAAAPDRGVYALRKGGVVAVAMGRSGDVIEVGSAAGVTPHLRGLAVRASGDVEVEASTAMPGLSNIQASNVMEGNSGMQAAGGPSASSKPHMDVHTASASATVGTRFASSLQTRGTEGSRVRERTQEDAGKRLTHASTTTTVDLRAAEIASISEAAAAAAQTRTVSIPEVGQPNGDRTGDDAGTSAWPRGVHDQAVGASLRGQGASVQQDPKMRDTRTGKHGKGKKRRSADREGVGVLAASGTSAGPVDAQEGFDDFASIAELIAGPAGTEPLTLEKSIKRGKAKKKRQGMPR
jgi:hypothetical protein